MYMVPAALALAVFFLALAFRRSFGHRSAALLGSVSGGGCAAFFVDPAQIRTMLIAAVALTVVFGVVAVVLRR
ncbi:MAG: hypothetical protein SPK00_02640 [Corynebacterium glucuronolyticum]|nr:hypothetical protein [Mycobacteriaceae bacterium]MDY5833636.1 hypothetical protein [Corynebacterium glucuronolyticum]